MTIKAFEDLNCAMAKTLAFLGERWTILIVRDLFLGFRRFDQLQARLGVASNVLSERLATLVEEGVIEKRPYSNHAGRFEYRLTQKGRDLQPVLLAILAWGDRYKVGSSPLLLEHTECGHRMHAVAACSHCGGELTPENVKATTGPGATKEQVAEAKALRAAAA